jgi:predicted small lipoprotein YifL
MLREIPATSRAPRAARALRLLLTATAVAIVGVTTAACGIKGPLKLPPPPAAAPSSTAPAKPGETPAAPAATPAPAPARQ